MRARNIKPGFFINSDLAEVDYASRLLFIGLWCYADREGRFEWKPKQIKACIFPYDNVDIDKLLYNLLSLHVITCHDGVGYVEHFKKHQNPHPHEAKSILPEKHQQNQCHDMSLNVTKCNADIMIPDSLIPDIRKPDTKTLSASFDAEQEIEPDFYLTKKKRKLTGERLLAFNQFWDAFGDKNGKAEAADAWIDIKPLTRSMFDKILAAAEMYAKTRTDIKAKGLTPKMAQGWINGRRWEDETIIQGEGGLTDDFKKRFLEGD